MQFTTTRFNHGFPDCQASSPRFLQAGDKGRNWEITRGSTAGVAPGEHFLILATIVGPQNESDMLVFTLLTFVRKPRMVARHWQLTTFEIGLTMAQPTLAE